MPTLASLVFALLGAQDEWPTLHKDNQRSGDTPLTVPKSMDISGTQRIPQREFELPACNKSCNARA
jgi:hypothetical protein